MTNIYYNIILYTNIFVVERTHLSGSLKGAINPSSNNRIVSKEKKCFGSFFCKQWETFLLLRLLFKDGRAIGFSPLYFAVAISKRKGLSCLCNQIEEEEE